MRALQLGTARERRAIAVGLANIVAAAQECAADPASRLVLDHGAVLASRREIEALIDRLRSDFPVRVRGVARARLLIEAPGSPLWGARSGGTVEKALLEIAADL